MDIHSVSYHIFHENKDGISLPKVYSIRIRLLVSHIDFVKLQTQCGHQETRTSQ